MLNDGTRPLRQHFLQEVLIWIGIAGQEWSIILEANQRFLPQQVLQCRYP